MTLMKVPIYLKNVCLSFPLLIIVQQTVALCVCVELLEQLQGCLLCGPAKGNWMKKSENMLIWLSKIVLPQHFSTGCQGCW
jgi:hypothetical protein